MRGDYDELLSKTHTFKVRGETFTWDDVKPEILSTFEAAKNGKKEPDVWEVLDQQILLFIVPEDHERWHKLRAQVKNPVTIAQMTELLKDLMEETTGRPTTAPSA
jgi:hypothetical protein